MKKKCTKKAYRDKNQATHALHLIKNDEDGRKKPTRCYECPLCKKWHLTSQYQ